MASPILDVDIMNAGDGTWANDFFSKPIDPEKLISTIASRAERYRKLSNLRKQR